MPAVIRLQDAKSVVEETQRLEEAIDVGPYAAVAVQARSATTGGVGALLYLQHSAVWSEVGFVDIDAEFIASGTYPMAIGGVTNNVVVVKSPMRYLRWRLDWPVGGSTPQTLQIDVVGREG